MQLWKEMLRLTYGGIEILQTKKPTVLSNRTLVTPLKRFTAVKSFKKEKAMFYRLHLYSLTLFKQLYIFITVNQVRISAIPEKNVV